MKSKNRVKRLLERVTLLCLDKYFRIIVEHDKKALWIPVLADPRVYIQLEYECQDTKNGINLETWKSGKRYLSKYMTDDGTKTSLKGLCCVIKNTEDYSVITECLPETEKQGELQIIYEDGKFYNQISLTEIREKIKQL